MGGNQSILMSDISFQLKNDPRFINLQERATQISCAIKIHNDGLVVLTNAKNKSISIYTLQTSKNIDATLSDVANELAKARGDEYLSYH